MSLLVRPIVEAGTQKAHRFRASAKHLREVAKDLHEGYRRDLLLTIADDYERMAEEILR